jgi:hypothetical protein
MVKFGKFRRRNDNQSVSNVNGYVLFLDEKNQKSSQQKGFFALDAFALQIAQNLGCKQLPLGYARSRPALLQIFAMPCLCAHWHHRFVQFRLKLFCCR